MSGDQWMRQELGAVLQFEYGAALPAAGRSGDGFPVFGSSGEVGRHRNAYVHRAGIIIGRKGTVGAVTWSAEPFWPIDTTYYVVPLIEMDQRWCYWLLSMLPLERLDSSTGVPGLNRNDAYTLEIPLLPLLQQRRIAGVLDTADDAIRQTEALIAKLKQLKQGLLHDLLTCGLDEHGELRDPITHPDQFKDSPLGRIPRDWEIRTADFLCNEIVVGIVVKPTQYYTNSGVPVLRSANIRDTGLDLSQLVYMSERSNQMLAKSRIAAGDVVTVRTGYPGTSCVIPTTFKGGNCVDIIVSRPGPELDSYYFALWINSEFGKGQVLRVQGGLAQQHFNTGDLKRLLVATPPHPEQVRIRQSAETASARIRAEEAYRDKLQLLKKGLMQDLLTGRVRVPVPEPDPELIEAGA